MRTVSLIFIFGLLALPALAQVNVILLRDTASYQVSPTKLDKQYASLMDLFRAKPQGAFNAAQSHSKEFETFIQKRADTPKRGFYLMVYAYYKPDGHADWVLVSPDRPQSDSVLSKALSVLNEFYSTSPYPASGSVPFRTITGIAYGQSVLPARTVRRGPGIISTLEAAEKTTRPDTVTMLAFNQLELTSIPEVVYRFPKLAELDLSKNSLHELPARLTADIPTLKRLSILYNAIPNDSVFITHNKHLVSLNLQGNKLTKVPASVRKNRRLESLWLGNNKLTELDTKPLRRLRRLSDLNLYNAGLTQLPKTIGRLKHVRVLDLYYNNFTTLPDQIGRMKRLEQLAVAHNGLHDLPASLAKLRRLTVLFAHHNRIRQLPTEFQQLANLHVLDLGYNWLSIAPPVIKSLSALEELSLNNNELKAFPDMLRTMKGLKKVYLGSNPLFGGEALSSPYAPLIKELEANKMEVLY